MRSITIGTRMARLRPRKSALAAAAVLSAALLLSLASCQNNYGIYASIQQEEPGSTTGPFYETSVGKVIKFGSVYYAQRSTLDSSADGVNWNPSPVKIAGFDTNYACLSMASNATALYVIAYGIDSSNNPYGLGLYSTTDGSTWTPVITNDSAMESIFEANGNIFIVDHTGPGATQASPTTTLNDAWSLHYLSGPQTLTAVPVTNLPNGSPIVGVAYAYSYYWLIAAADQSGGVYGGVYAMASASLGSGSFTAAGSGSTAGIPSIIDPLAIMTAASTGVLYIGDYSGNVYRITTSGTAFTAISSAVSSYSIACFAEVPTSLSSNVILAGLGMSSWSLGNAGIDYGYVQLDPSSSTLAPTSGDSSVTVPNNTNYDTTIYGKPVNYLSWIPDGSGTSGKLYAGTASAGISAASGLWLDPWNNSSNPAWSGWSPE